MPQARPKAHTMVVSGERLLSRYAARYRAGRSKKPIAEVCEKCPTPAIMDYHRFLNRQVVLFTLVGLLERARVFFGDPRSATGHCAADLRSLTTGGCICELLRNFAVHL